MKPRHTSKKTCFASVQVKHKYTPRLAELFTETFCWLPLAHCLCGKVLVVHGGLFSRDGVTLDEIRHIDRNRLGPWAACADPSSCLASSIRLVTGSWGAGVSNVCGPLGCSKSHVS